MARLNTKVSRVKVSPWMSFQETQPCGAGLRIYTMDSLFEIGGLQQQCLALKR